MTKVTISKEKDTTPSSEIIKSASKVFTRYDELGRKLTIKLPSFQDNMRYDLYFGKFDETNKKFYESNKFILFIKEIDEIPVAFPSNETEALALAARLGNEGVVAVMDGITEHFGSTVNNNDDSEVKATLKKL